MDNALVVEIVRTTGTAIVAPLAYLLARSVTRRRVAEIATFERRHHPTNLTLMVDERVGDLIDPRMKAAADQHFGSLRREMAEIAGAVRRVDVSVKDAIGRLEGSTKRSDEQSRAILETLSVIHRTNQALGVAIDEFRRAVGS